jgi:hypothetical protein
MYSTREEVLANPAGTNEAVAALLEEADKVPQPVIPLPPSDMIELPGGLVHHGEVYKSVRVQELKGIHEEALARAFQPAAGSVEVNWAGFLTTLLECGVVQFGELEEKYTRELLKDVLLGDRDALILGIRAATYGDEIDLKGWQCPECRGISDLTLSLSKDIEVVQMRDPREDSVFSVSLRRGRSALVRLSTGRDVRADRPDQRAA